MDHLLWTAVHKHCYNTQNMPVQDLALSPAQMLFRRPLRDHLPVKPGMFRPSEVWITTRNQWELALRHRISQSGERWAAHTKPLPDLKPGQNVFIQNQQGAENISKKWERTGLVIEDNGHVKYTVKVDGSGRLVQRNRRYLGCFKPMESRQPGTKTQVKIELDGMKTNTTKDHYETLVDRNKP